MPIKVALIHDWLITYRGGEKVLEAICEMYPDADIFTLFYRPGQLPETITRHRIKASFLNRFPGVEKYYRYLLPLFPKAIESFDLTGYDLVISTSHCVAKSAVPAKGAKHLCYCFTPSRYFWDKYDDYFGDHPLEPIIKPVIGRLREWDERTSKRVDHFVADSSWVKKRIENYYHRDAEVIFPFAALDFYTLNEGPREDFYLIVSALVPYKRIELAIQACRKIGRKLWIIGSGPEETRLKEMSDESVRFLGGASDDVLRDAYRRAKAFLFPGEEDFGITALEAMASGLPVIGLGRGGLLDTVVPGETGHFYSKESAEGLAQAILEFESKHFSPRRCRDRAENFSLGNFQSGLRKSIDGMLVPSAPPPPSN